MASVAASFRRVVTTTVRQSPSQICWSAIKTPLVLRSFSSYQSLWAGMETGSQVGMNAQAGQRVEVLDGVAHREPPEGDLDNIAEKEWEFDDFSSMAHAELERHREARQYARVAAYEMPRLSELVKPFVPLTKRKLSVFATLLIWAKNIQLNPKYNPDTDIVRMSSEMFQHQAQNKRYLSDLVDSLIAEAKDLTETFEDIPFDFRHHEAKKAPPKPKFPKEWRLSPKRRAQLEQEKANLEKMFEQ